MNCKVISFYTDEARKDTFYSSCAMRMKTVFDYNNIQYNIVKPPVSMNRYDTITKYKPEYIHECIQKFKCSVLWLDVDTKILSPDKLKNDIKLHQLSGHDFISTFDTKFKDRHQPGWNPIFHVHYLYFNYSAKSIKFLEKWKYRCKVTKTEGDHYSLLRLYDEVKLTNFKSKIIKIDSSNRTVEPIISKTQYIHTRPAYNLLTINYVKSRQTSPGKKLKLKVDIIDKNFISYDQSVCRFQQPAYLKWNPTLNSGSKSIFLTDLAIPTVDNLKTRQQKVAWLLEPRAISPHIYSYIEEHYNKFRYILTYDDKLLKMGPNFLFYPYGCCWITSNISFKDTKKTGHVSIIASDKKLTTGHQLRYQAIKELDMVNNPDIDVIGNGYKPFKDKQAGLQKYKFSIVIENSIQDTYFTEKIIDCFATKTVPIYYGTSKITNFFDRDGIIMFNNINELKQILQKISDQVYKKMNKSIEKNFNSYKDYIIPENYIFEKYNDLLFM